MLGGRDIAPEYQVVRVKRIEDAGMGRHHLDDGVSFLDILSYF